MRVRGGGAGGDDRGDDGEGAAAARSPSLCHSPCLSFSASLSLCVCERVLRLLARPLCVTLPDSLSLPLSLCVCV
eukprot:COSAG02_NODE_3697_length_6371_cov_40.094866_7_plen_75_part_00